MAETVQGIIDDLKNEAQVDATDAQLLRDLNRRWSAMLSDAKAYRKVVSIGTTVSGTAFYAATVIELYSLAVDGVPYDRAHRRDAYEYEQGRLIWWPSDLGLAYGDANSSAAKGVTLIPTPDTTGLAITGFAAVAPPDLTADAPGNTLLTAQLETDLMGPLTMGVIADRYRREHRWDLASSAEADFANGTEKLRRRAARRFRNTGPTMIRLA